ncbi:hypothetical protein [uncultured Nostoc sp.]|uniref:hypothetical protein n=1 Tax=uncultured Nostoc sp. TaxID=340711 RepID=UPI0035CC6BC3
MVESFRCGGTALRNLSADKGTILVEEAANYTPVCDWVLKAVPFILNLKPKDNGIPLTIS